VAKAAGINYFPDWEDVIVCKKPELLSTAYTHTHITALSCISQFAVGYYRVN
jgi:hypothetical protein